LVDLVPQEKLYMASLIYLDGEKYVRASVAMESIVTKVAQGRQVKPGLLYIDSPALIQMVPAACKVES
jgi:hypothetical protein